MPKQVFRRAWNRRSSRSSRPASRSIKSRETPHGQAIRALVRELEAQDGLSARLHSGVTRSTCHPLVPPGIPVFIEKEKAIRIGGGRVVPDLVLRSTETGPIILVIEVWHTHAVSQRKRSTFRIAGLPWIEVRSWHVLARLRKEPVAVLDWGGPNLPLGPGQGELFPA